MHRYERAAETLVKTIRTRRPEQARQDDLGRDRVSPGHGRRGVHEWRAFAVEVTGEARTRARELSRTLAETLNVNVEGRSKLEQASKPPPDPRQWRCPRAFPRSLPPRRHFLRARPSFVLQNKNIPVSPVSLPRRRAQPREPRRSGRQTKDAWPDAAWYAGSAGPARGDTVRSERVESPIVARTRWRQRQTRPVRQESLRLARQDGECD
jgi:hypothetical protein